MKKWMACLVSALAIAGAPIGGVNGAGQAAFEGRVVVEWLDDAFVPSMRTVEDFGFRQAKGKLWSGIL